MNEFIKKLQEEGAVTPEEINKMEAEGTLSMKASDKKNDLNDDQNSGLKAILDWLYTYKGSRNENGFFTLRGSAGTGKTTLIGQLLKDIDRMKYSSGRICICAPTHKAKKVLGIKTNWPNKETLQSLLGLKLDTNIDDFDPNKPEFSQIGTRKIQDYSFVIIDEASMINTALYKLLVDTCKGCMILFVGDHVQLNPVKEFTISLALTNPVHSYTLTTPARQKVGNPLLDLLNTLRYDIENNTSVYQDVLKNFPGSSNAEGEGYKCIKDSTEFAKLMKAEFSSEDFKINKDHVRYIAWTNDSITKTNRWIRKAAFGFDNTLSIGEVLLCYRTIIKEEEAVIVNSDDYLVEEVKPSIVSHHAYPLQTLEVKISCIDTNAVSYITVLDREEINYKNYMSIYDEYLTEAKVKKIGKIWSQKFYPFKDSMLLTDKLQFTSQLVAKETINKDLDYGYGITAHKSQGSTYKTVFVNYKDIAQIVTFARPEEKNDAEIMKKRLLYVALSRASKNAYIIM